MFDLLGFDRRQGWAPGSTETGNPENPGGFSVQLGIFGAYPFEKLRFFRIRVFPVQLGIFRAVTPIFYGCPSLIENPIMLKNCEHYFCRACIGGIVRHGNPTCPECRDPFNPDADIGNARLMRMVLGDIQLKCPYNGCEEIVLYDYGFHIT